MIRITDNAGAVGVGLCRSYIEALLRGERVCIPGGMGAPHICLFFGENDGELLKRANQLWHDGMLPFAPFEVHGEPTS